MRAVTSSSFCRVFGSSRPRFLGSPPAPPARCSPRRAPGDAAAGDGAAGDGAAGDGASASASSGAPQFRSACGTQTFMLQYHLLRGRRRVICGRATTPAAERDGTRRHLHIEGTRIEG